MKKAVAIIDNFPELKKLIEERDEIKKKYEQQRLFIEKHKENYNNAVDKAQKEWWASVEEWLSKQSFVPPNWKPGKTNTFIENGVLLVDDGVHGKECNDCGTDHTDIVSMLKGLGIIPLKI